MTAAITPFQAPGFSKTAFFTLIVLSVLFEVAGDILFKKWVLENKTLFLAVGLALYLGGTIFWAFSLKTELLSKSISVFTVLNLIAVVLAGMLFFGEKLTEANKLGILLGIASIILLEA